MRILGVFIPGLMAITIAGCGEVKKGSYPVASPGQAVTNSLPLRGTEITGGDGDTLTVSIPRKYHSRVKPRFGGVVIAGQSTNTADCRTAFTDRTDVTVKVRPRRGQFPANEDFYIRLTRPPRYARSVLSPEKKKDFEEYWFTVRRRAQETNRIELSPEKSKQVFPDGTEVEYIAGSPSIRRGGSAVVVFRVKGTNARSILVRDSTGGRYFPQRFILPDYYVTLIGWTVWAGRYGAWIEVRNSRGNRYKMDLPMPTEYLKYPVTRLTIERLTVKDKSEELGLKVSNQNVGNKEQQYRTVTEKMNQMKEVDLIALTSQPGYKKVLEFSLVPFRPMEKYWVSSSFGLLRQYYLDNKKMRESYHFGLDMTWSQEKQPIISDNPGTVVYAGYNGGYGNTIVIHHGMGLYSSYSHCSELYVKKGDRVQAGQKIARTGASGYATGDHLHFSVIVQGNFINPSDWMNKKWLENNIADVLERAKKEIESRKGDRGELFFAP